MNVTLMNYLFIQRLAEESVRTTFNSSVSLSLLGLAGLSYLQSFLLAGVEEVTRLCCALFGSAGGRGDGSEENGVLLCSFLGSASVLHTASLSAVLDGVR